MRASSCQAQMIRCHPKVSWEHSVKGSRNSRPVRSHCLPCLPCTLCLTAGQSVHNNWRIADARPRTLGSISMYLQHLLPPDTCTLPTVVEACSASMQTVKQGFGAFLVCSDCDWRFSVFVPTHHSAASQYYTAGRGGGQQRTGQYLWGLAILRLDASPGVQ